MVLHDLARRFGIPFISLFSFASILSGCEQLDAAAAEERQWLSAALQGVPLQQCRETISLDEKSREIVQDSPFCSLQSGRAEWVCFDGSRSKIESITKEGVLFSYSPYCSSGYSNERSFYYEGEIDLSFLQLIENIEAELAETDSNFQMMCESGDSSWCDHEQEKVALIINSPGGDTVAAIAAARIMSRRHWTVAVSGEDSCSSACVFLVAAAAERVLQGQIGIHRIFPMASGAKSRDSLNRLLAEITVDAKDLLRENGVSPSLVDDMMTVPSSKVRILSRAELEDYGLGANNSAEMDLQRALIERSCGADFSRRLIQAEALSEPCGGSIIGGDIGRYLTCLNTGYAELGFPDQRCPEKGPKFACPDPDARYGRRYSYERCE